MRRLLPFTLMGIGVLLFLLAPPLPLATNFLDGYFTVDGNVMPRNGGSVSVESPVVFEFHVTSRPDAVKYVYVWITQPIDTKKILDRVDDYTYRGEMNLAPNTYKAYGTVAATDGAHIVFMYADIIVRQPTITTTTTTQATTTQATTTTTLTETTSTPPENPTLESPPLSASQIIGIVTAAVGGLLAVVRR